MVSTSNLIDYSSDPAFALDNNMRVTDWNAGARELLGYSVNETRGQPCGKVLRALYPTGEPLCSILCEGRACFLGGKKWGIGHCLVRHKNGEMVNVGISSLVVPPEARSNNVTEPSALIFLRKTYEIADDAGRDIPLRVFAMGPFGLASNGRGLNVDGWKRKHAAVVFKCLVSQLDKPVHRERLIEWVWPNSDPGSGWNRLKVTISYLRSQLREGGADADMIETVGQSYLLRRKFVWVDADAFCALVNEGRILLKSGDLTQALEQFEDAESLYRGEYFEDERYSEWCGVERERLHEIYLELLSGLANCYTETGHYITACRVCRKALSSDPCRENFVRSLMECLVRLNQTGWARANFANWRDLLAREYGLQPTADTLEAYRQIVGDDEADYQKTG